MHPPTSCPRRRNHDDRRVAARPVGLRRHDRRGARPGATLDRRAAVIHCVVAAKHPAALMAAKIARGGRTFQGCYLSAHLVTAVRQSPLTDTELAAQIGASVYTLQAWLRAYTRTRRDDP